MRSAVALAVLGCAIGLAGMADPSAGAKRFQQIKGRATAIGTYTPGMTEQVAVRRMPKRAKLEVLLGPAGAPGACSGPFVCLPVKARRAPGARRFRTSGKGRALLTFTMPDGYERFRIDKPKAPNERVPFVNGQRVLVTVDGFASHRRKVTFGAAIGRTTVEIP